MMFHIGLLFVLHFLADFLLQDREMAQKKSVELKWLLKHIGIHFSVFFILLIPFIGFVPALGVAFINAACHGVIDWNVWNVYKYSVKYRNPLTSTDDLKSDWKYWEDHLFWTTIGLDQLLHGLSIILAYWWVIL